MLYPLYPLFVEKIYQGLYQGLACETVHFPASMSIHMQSHNH
jgi:hypothetical protein